MRIRLLALSCLVLSCAPKSDWLTLEDALAIADRASEMGYSCSSFEERDGGYVSNLRVGAPTLTPEGQTFCQLDRDFPYTALDDEDFLGNLECRFSGQVDLSEWECVRGVPVRRLESRQGRFDSLRPD